MCLHLAASTFWAIAAFKPAWQRRGDLGHLLFAFARHRPGDQPCGGRLCSRLLELYLGLEIIGGLLGLAVLAYARKSQV